MSTAITRSIMEFGQRHPIIGGLAISAAGCVMANEGAKDGAKLAEFVGGAQVVGRVLTADADRGREPRFAADVTWVAGGATHRALVQVPSSLLPDEKATNPEKRLRPGSELAVVLSTRNADAAISAESLSSRIVVTVAGRTFTFEGPFGVVIILLGLACARFPRLFGATETEEAAKPRAPSYTQRPGQVRPPRR